MTIWSSTLYRTEQDMEAENNKAKHSRQPLLEVMIEGGACSIAIGGHSVSVEGASGYTYVQCGPSLSNSTPCSYIDLPR